MDHCQSSIRGIRFTNYGITYTIRGQSQTYVTITNRLTTAYQISGLSGVSVGDEIVWEVDARYYDVDDDGNDIGESVDWDVGVAPCNPALP